MKSTMRYLLFLMALGIFYSCDSKTESVEMNALETGRQFIRASLDGNFKIAEPLILTDAENQQQFQRFETFYSNMPVDDKNKYKASSYEINKFLEVNDSTTIINYSNSYMKKPMEIKLIRVNKAWMVDFKYTSSGNLPID